jgi:hypothetical protein
MTATLPDLFYLGRTTTVSLTDVRDVPRDDILDTAS